MPEPRRSLVGALLILWSGTVACSRVAPHPPIPAPRTVEVEAVAMTPEAALRPVDFGELPVFVDDGDWASLRQAIERSRRWLAGRPSDKMLTFGPRRIAARELAESMSMLDSWLAEDPTPEAFAARVAQAFEILESVGNEGDMLITGYYVPVIAGSLRRTPEYNVPVYGPPGNLIRVDLGQFSDRWKGMRTSGRLSGGRLLPYPDRSEIRRTGALQGREIAWARDKVDLFFIEVQGSGVLRLPDGREFRIGYAGANGRDYRSIGKLLIDEGKIEREKVSMQSIRAYLGDHPEEVDRVLDYNQSVVFFRRLDGPPLGSLGFPVTGRRSVATDHKVFPQGALGFLVTDLPAMGDDGRTVAEGKLTRFVLNQDRGGAIRGAGRLDFFWGRGEEAAERAGVMKQPGRLFFLLPKSDEAEDTAELAAAS